MGLLWALVTVVLTVLLGRFFCGWVCPFGSIHHLVGVLGRRGKPFSHSVALNQYRRAQSIKYYLLFLLLSAASGVLLARLVRVSFKAPPILWILLAGSIALAILALFKIRMKSRKVAGVFLFLLGFWTIVAFFISADRMIAASLQTGLLDPIPLIHRSVNLLLLPLCDATIQQFSASQRYYEGTWLIGTLFLVTVLLNLKIPRFYCRFICPLGALYGVLGRFALWRLGKKTGEGCANCAFCEANCEGGCEPAGQIRLPECVLCMNCLSDCKHGLMTYHTLSSATGEMVSPDISRRAFVTTLVSGIAAVPFLRLNGELGSNWNSGVIRPPGALDEQAFLTRCIKCGQCMRICPTNIIHPAGIQAGLEGLWTPVLNFRIGTSGCQLNCIACSYICPTAAIRPISLDEKLGRNTYAGTGPIKLGTAFVDHGRCLPWAMDRPCIVCQENCPVSPKAIFVREYHSTIREGILSVKKADALIVELEGTPLKPDQLATGDYYLKTIGGGKTERKPIVHNTDRVVKIGGEEVWEPPPAPGTFVEVQVRLQRPQVDPERCIGCGVCEHECPVSGKRAIRVTAENESRHRKHSFLV
jgi:polyferredoxin